MDNQELIWVDKKFAEQYKKLETEKDKNEKQSKILDDYINKLSEQSKADFKANLESLEEDVAIYTGLMLKTKQAFGKAKDEALEASYALWEEFEKEKPKVSKKIEQFTELLTPFQKQLNDINTILSKINTFDIDKFIESLMKLTGLYGKSKEMFEFLVKNYKSE